MSSYGCRFVAMENIAHIYIYGDICNYQSEDAEYWGCVSLTTVKNSFEKQKKDCKEVCVHIHSRGGDVYEGFAIYDYLIGLGLPITTIVEGLCASIATVPFLAGSVRQLTENSRFLIHNPWTFADGNADDLREVADELEVEQKKLLDFYVEKTGGDPELLQALMNEDKIVDADVALELKFATEILETVVAINAYMNRHNQHLILNSIKTNKRKMKAEKKTKLQGFIASVKTLLGSIDGLEAADDVTASTVTLEDESILYFAEAELAEGIAVFTDEALTTPAADGDYTAKNGDTITVADGKVSTITVAASAETDAEKIARLEGELLAANALAGENEVLATALGDQLEAANGVLAQVKSSGWKPQARVNQPANPKAATKPVNEPGGCLKDKVAAEKLRRIEAGKKK